MGRTRRPRPPPSHTLPVGGTEPRTARQGPRQAAPSNCEQHLPPTSPHRCATTPRRHDHTPPGAAWPCHRAVSHTGEHTPPSCRARPRFASREILPPTIQIRWEGAWIAKLYNRNPSPPGRRRVPRRNGGTRAACPPTPRSMPRIPT